MKFLDGGAAGTWNVFLACEDLKKSELFELQTCVSTAAQILFGHKWNKPATASLLFLVLLKGIVASVVGLSFCNLFIKFEIGFFSYHFFAETFAIGFKNWFLHKWIDFEVFCLNIPRGLDFESAGT